MVLDYLFWIFYYGVSMVFRMTEKQFTIEEMYTHTNTLLISYGKLFKNNQMSFAEFTLIKSIIMEIQAEFEEMVEE